MYKLTSATVQPSHRAALSFFGLILLQGFHETEHIVQIVQRFILHDPTGAGILGSWVDIEPVHLAYNGVFLGLIALCFWVGGFWRNLAQHHPVVVGLMSFALFFETYHFLEHVVKMAQFFETGTNGTPGLLGQFVNLVWLHFTYNTIAYIPLLIVFFVDGYYTSAMSNFSTPLFRIGKGTSVIKVGC